jgi:hypothetical protein
MACVIGLGFVCSLINSGESSALHRPKFSEACSVLKIRPVYFRRKYKITPGQAFDLVSVGARIDPARRQAQIGMMALCFCDRADAIHKIQRCFEIGEEKSLFQVMPIHNLPLGKLRGKLGKRLAFQWRHAAAAWLTGLIGVIPRDRPATAATAPAVSDNP